MDYIDSPLAILNSQNKDDKNSFIILSDMTAKNIINENVFVGLILRPNNDGTFLVSTYSFEKNDIEKNIKGLLAVDENKISSLTEVGIAKKALSILNLINNEVQTRDIDNITELKQKVNTQNKEFYQTGFKTLLNKYQSKVTATEEFKKWFGNSKVVDENGKPLVV